MKVFCIFSDNKNVSLFGTNKITTENLSQELNNSNNNIISYTLNDTPLTKKFITEWERYRKIQIDFEKGSKLTYHYNYYTSINQESIRLSKIEMNNTIQRLQQLGYDLSNDLILNLDIDDNEMDKLNELHFIFEKSMVELSLKDEHYDEKFMLFEKINSIVHFIEHDHETGSSSCYVSVRPLTRTDVTRYMLVDEDYQSFTFVNGGDLLADFSMVGKDLYACSSTNDVELVMRNEVKPQDSLTDFIFMVFESGKNDSSIFDRHFKWCKDNQIDKYLDYNQPKYKPGRHVLGRIDQPIYSGTDFIKEIYSKTPMFLGYYVGYDDGKPLSEGSI